MSMRIHKHFSRKNVAVVVATLIILVVSGVFFVRQVPAQIALPFGGRSLLVEFCNTGAVITVGPPVPGRFYYQPGATRVFAHYQITRPGVWLLGTQTNAPGTCIISSGKSNIIIPYQGVINIVGTSL